MRNYLMGRLLLLVVVMSMTASCADLATDKPVPEIVKTWTSSELYNKVIEAGLGSASMMWRDYQYREATRESVEAFIEWDDTDQLRRTGFFDCDDFALIFDANIHKWCSGIAAGQIYYQKENGARHAVNIIFMDGDFFLLDPETDKLINPIERYGMIYWFLF